MSNMSSFYGGRPGAPFVIVKTFDAVKIPTTGEDNKIYTKSYYALDEHGNYYITDNKKGNVQLDEKNFLIKKTAENYNEYNWKLTTNNGITKINQTELTFPEELAEGMINCFEKGISTLDEVNYQEYVLIDTVTNLNEYLNPDNGKLFRRGLDINNGMYGAEYVGRIVGAQGFNTGIQLDKFSNIDKLNNPAKDKIVYSDLVPGGIVEKTTDETTGEEKITIKENKDIQCIYANILDEGGNVLETKIGFKFPYLVNTFLARPVVPYNLPDNLISEIDATENDNPFYRHWEIKVPNGVKGDSIEIIRTQPTIIPADTPYYKTIEALNADREANNNYANRAGIIADRTEIPNNAYYADGNYILLTDNAEQELNNKFIDAKLCTNKKVFYIIRNYDTNETGSISEPILIGDIDSIIKTNLANDGTLSFYYDNGKEEKAENKIRWITNLQVNSEDDGNQKLHVTYNTPKSNGKQEEDIGVPINFIKEMYVSNAKDSESTESVNVESKHLFIKFSDLDKQNTGITIAGKGSGWVDLGSIQAPAENIQILTGVSNLEALGKTPPEVLFGDIKYKGCVVPTNDTNSIYYYDYRDEEWKYIGTLGQGNVASKINYIGINKPDVNDMYTDSLWFEITEKTYER